MHAFLAKTWIMWGKSLDETEKITVDRVPLKQSIQMVRDNTIQDGKTIAILLYYHTFYMK